MSENRGLPEPTREEWVSCLSALIEWIDRDASSARGIRVVRAIALHDQKALGGGRDPEPMDTASIFSYLLDDGIRISDADAGDAIRNSKPEATLQKRLGIVERALQRNGLNWTPVLTRLPGGGRGHLTRYRLSFQPLLPPAEHSGDSIPPVSSASEVNYDSRPAKATWPLRWLFVPNGFPISLKSWRGASFLFLTLLLILLLPCAGLLLASSLRSGQLTWNVALATFVGAGFIAFLWPILRAVKGAIEQRVVECPDMLLAMSEPFGQIRCTRKFGTGVPVGWISLERISSTCPTCGGTVELMPGKLEFPGRMVGRCRDAPTEHVFSFDPTTYVGSALR